VNNTAKIADFDLAKLSMNDLSVPLQKKRLSGEVQTLYYRAPEILLGKRDYGSSADIWSVACVIVEMATGQCLFIGTNEQNQLSEIFWKLGTPTEEEWEEARFLPNWEEFPQREGTGIPLKNSTDESDLAKKMLAFDPSSRLTAKKALQHPFVK